MDRTDTKPVERRHSDDELDDGPRAAGVRLARRGRDAAGAPGTARRRPDGGAAVGTEPELQERPLPGPGRSPGGRVKPTDAIAQVAPPMERVPPRAYGGTERVIFELVQELDRRGHEVTTFASADSEVPGRLIATVPEALRPGRL